jgi:NAD(P)-dependent dehydrogenase (short-subunit alcohol dehydrogenase family)
MGKLDNKVVIITGAASGMGKEMAILFAKEGAKVVASDLNSEGTQNVVNQITSSGGIATGVVANVASEEDINKLIDTTIGTYGTLDVLVNNAGIMDNFMPIEKVKNEDWLRVMSVNLDGPMYAIRKAMPIFLQKKSGVIINISSIGGLQGSRAGAAYTASKHALIGLTKNVGFQYAKLGIRCNAIAPGGVNTNIGSTITNPDKFGMDCAMSGVNSNPRMGEAVEIAKAALFLASDDSSLVNGAVIVADSGWTAY